MVLWTIIIVREQSFFVNFLTFTTKYFIEKLQIWALNLLRGSWISPTLYQVFLTYMYCLTFKSKSVLLLKKKLVAFIASVMLEKHSFSYSVNDQIKFRHGQKSIPLIWDSFQRANQFFHTKVILITFVYRLSVARELESTCFYALSKINTAWKVS